MTSEAKAKIVLLAIGILTLIVLMGFNAQGVRATEPVTQSVSVSTQSVLTTTTLVATYPAASVKKYIMGRKITDKLRRQVKDKYGIRLHIVKRKVTANKDISKRIYKMNTSRSSIASGTVVNVSVYKYVNPGAKNSRGGRNLTKAECRETIQEYAMEHRWSKAKTKKVTRGAIDIVWGPGAHESSGGAFAGSKSGCYGPFQFNRGWIGKTDKRSSVRWSTRRYCKVWDDGGEAAIYRHWRATYKR